MDRMFKQHAMRKTFSLDGEWEHHFPREGTRIEPGAWASGERRVMDVPCVWEMLDERKKYRGQAVARRMVSVPEEGWLRLVFKGVSHTARVFFDGREIGGHHNAFTPFTLDAGLVAPGEHEVLVHISNEHGEISALHVPNDYYNYGGISRPVTMHLVPTGLLIRHVHAVTNPEGKGWQAACRAEIINLTGQTRQVSLRAALAGAQVSREVTLEAGSTTVDWEFSCPGARTWSPADPALYLLETALCENGQVVDDLVERIGFRTVAVRAESIFLNGEPFYPMGFNRHEDHPDYGCAIPVPLMRHDLALMRETGANAVRTSHYPNDERFLDLCDELGLLVWEENHARGLDLKAMQHPRFREQCATCNEEMVREHFNHPCIFVWGILNECASDTVEGARLYQEQFDQLRALDRSRPLTFASCAHDKDLCQGMVDIAGWNIYPRWYVEEPVRGYLEKSIATHDAEGMQGKPMIISEIGAAGLTGYHDPVRRPKWSEERQADILDEQIGCVLNHPRVGGIFVWQFCDVRVDESWFYSRVRCMNNKGAVDEHRRPKLAFEVIKRHFAAKTAAGKRWPPPISTTGEDSTDIPALSRSASTSLPCTGGECVAALRVPSSGAWRLVIRYRDVRQVFCHQLLVDGLVQGGVLFEPSGGDTATVVPVTLQLRPGPCRIELTGDWGQVTLVSLELVPVPDRTVPELPFALTNPKACREARLVMDFFQSIHGKAIVTGQQTMTPAGADVRFIEYHTGKQPALRGFDMLGGSSAVFKEGMTPEAIVEAVNNEGSVEAAIRWWKERRGLVTFCWHWHSPLHGRDKAFYTKNTDFNLEAALAPGTLEHDGVLKDLDMIAEQLKRLRDERVPVLWRPLHEAEGGWFWWGAKGAEPYKKLYRWMYERYTVHHRLDNLIWVWNAPAPGWYPGDDVVDLSSADLYSPPGNYGPLTAGHDQAFALAGGRKPVVLAENGPIPDLDELIGSRTPWLWFMTWGGLVMDEKQTSLAQLKRAFHHPYAVTSGQLPAWLFE